MRLLALKELKASKGVPYHKASLYRMIANGEFPRPIHLSVNRIAWIESEIDAWIASRIQARDAMAA
jgi:prophage regulatory protein